MDQQSGELVESIEWHRVVFKHGLADIVDRFLFGGSTVYVQGELRTRRLKDRDEIERYGD